MPLIMMVEVGARTIIRSQRFPLRKFQACELCPVLFDRVRFVGLWPEPSSVLDILTELLRKFYRTRLIWVANSFFKLLY